MERRFESHGLLFVVESDGFVRNDARDDFETICDRIENTLDDMPAEKVAKLHSGAIAQTDGPEAGALDSIGGRIRSDVTRSWHNPSGAIISLIALPGPD